MNERQTLSIAILSTSSDEVAFVNSALREAGHAAHCHQIQNPDEFSRSLKDSSLELIILSRDGYPDSVREAVKQRNKSRPEIPLIALQKSVDEASIQEAIAAGASDLVSVEGKSRLQAVVARELRTLRMERALNSTLSSATAYRQQLDDVMRYGASAIAYVHDGVIVDANNAWLNLFEIGDENEMIGLPLMDYFAAESQAAVKRALIATLKGEQRQSDRLDAKAVRGTSGLNDLPLEMQLVDREGSPHVQILIAAHAFATGGDQPAAAEKEAAKTDQGSVLLDRDDIVVYLNNGLQKKLKSGLRVLAYIRPDDFSAVRKSVGVLNTGEILTQFAGEVCGRLHPNDVAGRFEEAAILVLLERGNERDAVKWAEALVKGIQDRIFEAREQSITLTCTIGICAVSGAYAGLEELLSAVVDAHAQGCADGGNKIVLDQVSEANARVLEYDEIWVGRIKSALVDNRFRLAQLPIAGLRGGDARMFDILIRMIDEQGNEVLPADFLPTAQRNKLMNAIDRWVINAVMNFCSKDEVERAFVRLSTQSIIDTTLVSWIAQTAENHGLDPSKLCFQIPADDAAKHVQQSKDLAAQLSSAGYYFALEHYGIDRKNHRMLDMLKPNYLKIDGELMHTLASDSKIRAEVQMLMNAARERRIETIAERVESADAMAILFQLGVHFMQGHYVHEPEIVLQEK